MGEQESAFCRRSRHDDSVDGQDALGKRPGTRRRDGEPHAEYNLLRYGHSSALYVSFANVPERVADRCNTHLDGSREQVAVVRQTGRERRAVKEGEPGLALRLLERGLEGIDVAPVLEDDVLLLRERVRPRCEGQGSARVGRSIRASSVSPWQARANRPAWTHVWAQGRPFLLRVLLSVSPEEDETGTGF